MEEYDLALKELEETYQELYQSIEEQNFEKKKLILEKLKLVKKRYNKASREKTKEFIKGGKKKK